MRQITITLIALLALTMGMASCSHESPVPFLEEMGVCTDSLLIDSFPNPYYYESPGVSLSSTQCDSLGLYYYSAKIMSAKQFKDSYLLTFYIPEQGLLSVLYDKNGKVLDACNLLTNRLYPSKNYKGYNSKLERFITIGGLPHTVNGISFNWERHYIDSDKFEVIGRNEKKDTIITYTYKVSDKKITQISRKTNKNIKTALYDISSLPVSQTYHACDLINDNPKIVDQWCSVRTLLYTEELNFFSLYNTPAILQWILDHRNTNCNHHVFKDVNDIEGTICRVYSDRGDKDWYQPLIKVLNRKPVSADLIKKQILQIKDKESQQYLLKVLIK